MDDINSRRFGMDRGKGGLILGEPEDQDPYRSKLGGQLCLATITAGIQLPSTTPNPTLTIACDGLSTLKEVYKDRSILKSKQKHIDIISIINELWESSPFKMVKEHVYGRQDDLNRPLAQLEVLNCRMDTAANQSNL